MGQMKELFISMQEGLMQGVAIVNAERERKLDDEHKMSVSKPKQLEIMEDYKKFLPTEVVKDLDLLDDKAIESMIIDRGEKISLLRWSKNVDDEVKKLKSDKADLEYYLHYRTKSKLNK